MVVRRAVWENRRKVLPPLPRNLYDFHNAVDSVEHVTTNRGENFVLQNDRTNRMIILDSKSNLNQLSAADIILMDGTALSFSAKFLPSTVWRMDITYLCFFCLLVTKLEDTYTNFSWKSIRSYANFSRRRSPQLLKSPSIMPFRLHGCQRKSQDADCTSSKTGVLLLCVNDNRRIKTFDYTICAT